METGSWFEQLLVAEIAMIEDVAIARKAAAVVASYVERREELDERLREDLEAQTGLSPDDLNRLEAFIQHRAVDEDGSSEDPLADAAPSAPTATDDTRDLDEWGTASGPLGSSRYQDFNRVGSGSMGDVYRARDVRLDRVVAIKVLRNAEGCSELARDRFVTEARIAARLQHPAIVPVHELGLTQNGDAYYVMPYVGGGRTLLDAITARQSTRERLALLEPFVHVCDAIQHAHVAGFIHCDIKPSNIALEQLGEPIVLDWGLARAVPTATSSVPGSISGTPGYMAPEACRQAAGPIAKHSDVYSLGATLFHILTGERPPEATNARGAAAIEHALSSMTGAPQPLADVCRRALVWDPARRAIAASEIADAIRTWQRGDEVRRESELIERDVRRLIDDAAALREDAAVARLDQALSLVGKLRELAPNNAIADELERACDLARQTARRQQEASVRAGVRRRLGALFLGVITLVAVGAALWINQERDAAQDAEGRAHRTRLEAEELADYMVGELRADLQEHGKLRLLYPVVRRALAYYRGRLEVDPSPRTARQTANALRRASQIASDSGDVAETIDLLREARAILEEHADHLPDADGQALWLRLLDELADALSETGQLDECLNLCREILAACPAGEQKKDEIRARTHSRLGAGLMRLGRTTEGLQHHTEALRRWRAILQMRRSDVFRFHLASARTMAGRAYRLAGDLPRSRRLLEDAERDLNALADRDALGVRSRYRLAAALRQLGETVYEFGDYPRASAALQRAKHTLIELTTRDAQNARWREELGHTHRNLSDVLAESGELDAADKELAKAHTIALEQAREDGTNVRMQKVLHASVERQGDLLMERRDYAKAVEVFERGRDLIASILDAQQLDVVTQSEHALAIWKVASARLELDQPEIAIELLKKATHLHEAIVDRHPRNVAFVERLIWSYYRTGGAWQALGQDEAAERTYRRGLVAAKDLTDLTTTGGPAREVIGLLQWKLGRLLQAGQPSIAREHYEAAEQIWKEHVQTHPKQWKWVAKRAHMWAMVAGTFARDDDMPAAAKHYRIARDTHALAVAMHADLKTPHAWYEEQVSYYDLIAELREPESAKDYLSLAFDNVARGRRVEALHWYERALQSEEMRSDLKLVPLYRAAICAAKAADEVEDDATQDTYRTKAVAWLRMDIALRKKRIAAITNELHGKGLTSESEEVLNGERRFHREHIDSMRTQDAFSELRKMKAFQELFE